MSAPTALVHLVEPWSHAYGDSKLLPTLVIFGHIAALVFAGGLAVTLDRATLRAARPNCSPEFRWRQLEELARAHRFVITGISLSFVTGLLLFAADVETFYSSWMYWTKMGLIVLLLFNGFLMTRTESAIRDTPNAADDAGWKRLRFAALVSFFLWFAIAFMGVALVNAA
jgi:hypothetical protein